MGSSGINRVHGEGCTETDEASRLDVADTRRKTKKRKKTSVGSDTNTQSGDVFHSDDAEIRSKKSKTACVGFDSSNKVSQSNGTKKCWKKKIASSAGSDTNIQCEETSQSNGVETH